MGKLAEKLETIMGNIKEKAADFTTLEVTTISGEIKSVLTSDGTFDTESLLKKINGKNGATKLDLQIIAHTKIDFDHDTVNFVKAKMEKDEKELYALHLTAIENAKASRQEMLKFIGELTSGIIN